MKNFETQSTTVDKGLTLTGVIEQNTIEYKNGIKDILNYKQEAANDKINNLSSQVNNELERIFGMDNEVNSYELKLATIFGKKEEILNLNNQKLSLAGVMQQLDNFQQVA